MRLEYESDPVTGQDFSFNLVEVQPPATLVYYVGNRPYGEEECGEATCTGKVAVPAGTAGEFLRLVVHDAVQEEEYRLRIEESA